MTTPKLNLQDDERSYDQYFNTSSTKFEGDEEDIHTSNNKLMNTNRLLSDLERKLSLSSNHTDQSHSSSVIVNKSLGGTTSGVLQYIKSEEDQYPLNTNEMYYERQNKFVTSFTKHYVDDKQKLGRKNLLQLKRLQQPHEPQELPPHKAHQAQEYNVDEEYEFEDEEDLDLNQQPNTVDVDDPDDEYDEEMLLPSPRSPPRDLDPDKLYGLYDFSGPDPSHCSLFRDEPVYLVNDQDNYWWLIKKMDRDERKSHRRIRRRKSIRQGIVFAHVDLDLDDEIGSDISDDEDGKIGFVPAECLETYGERLARLNCFKNEELEKNSKDTINIIDSAEQNSDLNLLLSRGNSVSTSLLRRRKSNKSVTFENLAELELNDSEDLSREDELREEQKKNFDSLFDVGYLEIPQGNTKDEAHSEVLSDVYPAGVGLDVKKRNVREISSSKLGGLQEALSDIDEVLGTDVNNHTETDQTQNSDIVASETSGTDFSYDTSQNEDTPGLAINTETLLNPEQEASPPSVHTPKIGQIGEHGETQYTNEPPLKLRLPGSKSHKKLPRQRKLPKSKLPLKLPLQQPFFAKPSISTSPYDTSSIGSFSPDTPPKTRKKSLEMEVEGDDDSELARNLSQLRRSVILDRLTKVTSDIQEQMGGTEYEGYGKEQAEQGQLDREQLEKEQLEYEREQHEKDHSPEQEEKNLVLKADPEVQDENTLPKTLQLESKLNDNALLERMNDENAQYENARDKGQFDQAQAEKAQLERMEFEQARYENALFDDDEDQNTQFEKAVEKPQHQFRNEISQTSHNEPSEPPQYVQVLPTPAIQIDLPQEVQIQKDLSQQPELGAKQPDPAEPSYEKPQDDYAMLPQPTRQLNFYGSAESTESTEQSGVESQRPHKDLVELTNRDSTVQPQFEETGLSHNSVTEPLHYQSNGETNKLPQFDEATLSHNSVTEPLNFEQSKTGDNQLPQFKEAGNSHKVLDVQPQNETQQSQIHAEQTNFPQQSHIEQESGKNIATQEQPLVHLPVILEKSKSISYVLPLDNHRDIPRNDILPDLTSRKYSLHIYPEDDDDFDDNPMTSSQDGDITPLTSMNSLSNGISTTWAFKTDLIDKRKLKPVHEMFMPILGKFDELAEKLAELEGML